MEKSLIEKDNVQEQLRLLEPLVMNRNYPLFQLLNENKQVIVPMKIANKNNKDVYLKHWNFIKYKILNEIPKGVYYFKGFYDTRANTHTEYKIIKQNDYKETGLQISEPLNEYTQMQNTIDIQEYKKLLDEVATLRGQVHILDIENKLYKKKIEDLENELDEVEPVEQEKSLSDNINAGFSALAPFVPMLEKFISQRDEQIALEKKKLEQQPQQKPKLKLRPVIKRKQLPQNSEIDYNQLKTEFENLLNTNEQGAEQYLISLNSNNPELANKLMNDFNIELENE